MKTPGQQYLERRRAERTVQYNAELAASEASSGKVVLPPLAEIVATKEAAEAERLKLEALAVAEKDAKLKERLTKAVDSTEAQKAYAESLERIIKGEPTKEDEILLAKLQESHNAECEAKRAWLAKHS